MRVLAIDPGYERLGLAVLERTPAGKDILLGSACFQTSAKLPFHDRLFLLGEEVGAWIQKWQPSVLAIETLFFNTNQKTAMRVSEARGAIIYEARRQGLSVREFTPLQIKIAITGDGRGSKEQVIRMVHRLVSFEKSPESSEKKDAKKDDEYDAIAIGLAFLASSSLRALTEKVA